MNRSHSITWPLYCIATLALSMHSNSVVAMHEEKVILYTFYTSSHEILLNEWFLPSLQDKFEVVVKQFEQECPTGTYMHQGWTQTMLHKIDLILEALHEHPDDIVIYADIDIQFFAPIQEPIQKCLRTADLVIQQDNEKSALCAGFMAIRSNNYTLQFFNEVRNRMLNNKGQSDQPTINQLLIKEKYAKVRWDYLPVCFFGTATVSRASFTNNKTWADGDDVIIPPNILLHHANYTSGIENKIKLLTYVRSHWMDPQIPYRLVSKKQRKEERKIRLKQKRADQAKKSCNQRIIAKRQKA